MNNVWFCLALGKIASEHIISRGNKHGLHFSVTYKETDFLQVTMNWPMDDDSLIEFLSNYNLTNHQMILELFQLDVITHDFFKR